MNHDSKSPARLEDVLATITITLGDYALHLGPAHLVELQLERRVNVSVRDVTLERLKPRAMNGHPDERRQGDILGTVQIEVGQLANVGHVLAGSWK